MSSITRDPTVFRQGWIDGFVSAYDRYVAAVPGASGVVRAGGPGKGKVGVVIGGGCGHYPAFAGLVGSGLADAAVIGDVFTSPSAEQAWRVGRAADGGAGILFSFGNYAGDVLNFGVAERRLRAGGTDCRTVLVTDDIASAGRDEVDRRRGIAGGLAVYKAAGAAAARGAGLDEVERVARLANARTRTLGVAFGGCTVPGHTDPLFTVDDGTVAVGLGIHGEPGVRSMPAAEPADLARTLVEPLLDEAPGDVAGGSSRPRAVAILNGLGATKYEELFVLWREVMPLLDAAGVEVVLPEVGEFVTSLDMAGCSLTLVWLDDELEELWAAPVDTPAFRRGDPGAIRTFESLGVLAAPEDDETVPPAGDASRRAAAAAREALVRLRDAVAAHEDELGRLDAVAGDGDHGSGMTRGLTAAVAASSVEGAGLGTTLRRAGRSFADRAGGTSGVLRGLLLEVAGDELGDEAEPTPRDVAGAVAAACAALAEAGRCEIGDKTLFDALAPFSAELAGSVEAGAGLGEAWARAARAATGAAERTADLRPRVGRARPLAERSLGTPDPGATSMALCLEVAGGVLGGAADDHDEETNR